MSRNNALNTYRPYVCGSTIRVIAIPASKLLGMGDFGSIFLGPIATQGGSSSPWKRFGSFWHDRHWACPAQEHYMGSLSGVVVVAGFVPYAIFAPLGGFPSDSADKRIVVFACNGVLFDAHIAFYPLGAISNCLFINILLMVAFGAQAVVRPCDQAAALTLVEGGGGFKRDGYCQPARDALGIVGPVIGGVICGPEGIWSIICIFSLLFAVGCICTLAFVHIPNSVYVEPGCVLAEIGKSDFDEAMSYLGGRDGIGVIAFGYALVDLLACSNLAADSPYIIAMASGFSKTYVEYAQAALALGGLTGAGLVAFGCAFKLSSAVRSALVSATASMATAVALGAQSIRLISYSVLIACYFAVFVACTAISVVALSLCPAERSWPDCGKTIAFATMLSNFVIPIGLMVYGLAFDAVSPWILVIAAASDVAAVSVWKKRGSLPRLPVRFPTNRRVDLKGAHCVRVR